MNNADLSNWLATVLSGRGHQIQSPVVVLPQNGDAGNRRYYRLQQFPDYLAVVSPPTENNQAFIEIDKFLLQQTINAPEIYAVDEQRGFMLLEFLGDHLLLDDLKNDNVDVLYGDALLTLLRLQQSTREQALDPYVTDYDDAALRRELEIFPQWFIEGLLQYKLSAHEQSLLKQSFNQLIDCALEQPRCFVHRDYHSRNLIHRKVGPMGVIDFQDARWGPFTYDLVSLLRDCYIRWPGEQVRHWSQAYANMAISAGICPLIKAQTFDRWFDWMGLQRHIKVLGVFSRLHLRDQKHQYLNDLPLVIRYTIEVAEQYDALGEFAQWFQQRLIPLAEQQSWYVDFRNAGERATQPI